MDAWAGRQCVSRNATFADIGGYPKRRTRRTVRQSSVAQRCGTKAGLTAGRGKLGSRLGVAAGREVRNYALAVDATSRGCLAGASATKAMPIMMNTADPISSLRAIMLSNAWNDITAAWAKLDHAANAIRLRCSDGLRVASSRKTPRVAYRLIIIANAGSCLTIIIKGITAAENSNPASTSTIFSVRSRRIVPSS